MNKITIYYAEDYEDVCDAYTCINKAIDEKIKEGRNNFMSYGIRNNSKHVSVCRNKNGFTAYIQKDGV